MYVRPAVAVEVTLLGEQPIRFVRVTALRPDVKFRIAMDGRWLYFIHRGGGNIELVGEEARRWIKQPSIRLLGAQGIPGTTRLFPDLDGCIVIGCGFVVRLTTGEICSSIGRVTGIEHAPGCTRRRPTRSKRLPNYLVQPTATDVADVLPWRQLASV